MVSVPPKKRLCVVITNVSSWKWLSGSSCSCGQRWVLWLSGTSWWVAWGGGVRVADPHLTYLIQEAIDEIAGLPRLPRLLVPLDLLRDEDPKLREILKDSVVRAWEPLKEGGENVVHLGGQDRSRTLSKCTSYRAGRLRQDFDVLSSRTRPFQH